MSYYSDQHTKFVQALSSPFLFWPPNFGETGKKGGGCEISDIGPAKNNPRRTPSFF
jgi:hypothetical protein